MLNLKTLCAVSMLTAASFALAGCPEEAKKDEAGDAKATGKDTKATDDKGGDTKEAADKPEEKKDEEKKVGEEKKDGEEKKAGEEKKDE